MSLVSPNTDEIKTPLQTVQIHDLGMQPHRYIFDLNIIPLILLPLKLNLNAKSKV